MTICQPRTTEELYSEYLEQRVNFFIGQAQLEGFVKDIYYCPDGVAFLLVTNDGHRIIIPWAKINYSIVLPKGSSIIDRQLEARADKRQPVGIPPAPIVQVDPSKVQVQ